MIIKTNQDEIQNYLSDASNFSGNCRSVYLPFSELEIIEILKSCHQTKTKVTISGNGTGLNGGRVPQGGIIISLELMNKIISFDSTAKTITVQPGVILKDLQDYVESKKLFYPPDPTESNCFIGATVATNASGTRTFKYGPSRDYVEELRIVIPDGRIINISRNQFTAKNFNGKLIAEDGSEINFTIPNYKMPKTKNASGYFCAENMDMIDLFIGSEGTLGVISEIKLKLIDLPSSIFSCIVFFNEEINALNFIVEARDHSKSDSAENSSKKCDARGLEFFDSNSLKLLAEKYSQIPAEAKAAVWFEQELSNNYDFIIDTWMSLINRYNGQTDKSWFAVNKNDQDKFKEFRHEIATTVNEIVTKRGLKKVGTDVAVPDKFFVEFYYLCKNKVENHNLDYAAYGHFGNSHIHLNILPKNLYEYELSQKIYSEICFEAVERNGTISAEHGIGKLKRNYLLTMYGESSIKQMAALKLVFDQNKILGIGNIFEEKYLNY